jgi:predicted Fe-S protein YdhL (DUF1289 family)
MSGSAGEAAQVQSPCVSICVMDTPTGLCAGCYRTLDEIAGWIGLSADERRVLLAELARRRARHGAAIAARCLADAQR